MNIAKIIFDPEFIEGSVLKKVSISGTGLVTLILESVERTVTLQFHVDKYGDWSIRDESEITKE